MEEGTLGKLAMLGIVTEGGRNTFEAFGAPVDFFVFLDD